MIIIIDFGSQTTHLIGRRLNELGISLRIINPENAVDEIKKYKPSGIILSGGPASVYEAGAPTVDKKVFDMKIPILGICYGQQLTAHILSGKTGAGKIKEYGPVTLHTKKSLLFNNIPHQKFQVWMSHGVEVMKLPIGFKFIASTENVKAAAMEHESRQIYGVQFHPEVTHTQYGMEILKNFSQICNETPEGKHIDTESIVHSLRETIRSSRVIMAFSGGTDSFVTAALLEKAIGRNLIPVYVDSGLMRKNALFNVKHTFPKLFGHKCIIVNARGLFLHTLKNITEPEIKRKKIGRLYVRIFEKISKKYNKAVFLAQGTTYADFIHSKSTKHAALIKSHHNVGGLPKKMKLKLIEPIRYFYTDQVRYIGKQLSLPDSIVYQQPFPGPGFAIRILGKITLNRLKKVKKADAIVVDEMEKAGLQNTVFQYFAVLTGTNTTAIKGDGRYYGEVVALRAYTTKDRMTIDWAKIPYDVLQKISSRIVNEVSGVSRVVYDITTKPPATMEWE